MIYNVKPDYENSVFLFSVNIQQINHFFSILGMV